MSARIDAYSAKVKLAKDALYAKYKLDDLKADLQRKLWLSFQFKPNALSAEELVDQIQSLKVPSTIAKQEGDEVCICFSMEIEQLPD